MNIYKLALITFLYLFIHHPLKAETLINESQVSRIDICKVGNEDRLIAICRINDLGLIKKFPNEVNHALKKTKTPK